MIFSYFLIKPFTFNDKLSMVRNVSQNTIKLGDYILLMHGRKKRWLVKVEENKEKVRKVIEGAELD